MSIGRKRQRSIGYAGCNSELGGGQVMYRRRRSLMFGRKIAGVIGAAALALGVVACAETDPGITTAVKAKLAADDTVKAYRIDVDTKDKVVTLSGAVDTPMAKERAVQVARAVDGVSSVVDNLTVTPGVTPTTGVDDAAQRKGSEAADNTGEIITDAAITSTVKTKLLGDTTTPGLKIDVDTANGVVTLSGTVANAAEKSRALELARETNGVKSVVDKIKVGKP
jgi:osmotically-inducible protein OsmY